MISDYKYLTEYAKSSRATCRSCKNTIHMGSLRMGELVQSYSFDGKMTMWFHYGCFFKKTKVLQTSDIKNFDGLKFEDQEKIISEIKSVKFDLANFCIKPENGDSIKCGHCSKLIKDPTFVDGKMRELGVSYHVKCFVNKFPGTDFTKISGLSKLKAQERQELLDAVTNLKPPRKRKTDTGADAVLAKKLKVEASVEETKKAALKSQSEELWFIRCQLDRAFNKQQLKDLLEFNDQHAPVGISNLLDATADALLFGVLEPCAECRVGALTYQNGAYRCTGMANEWARCLYFTCTPERRKFKIPESYHDVAFLKKYSLDPAVRLFADNVQAVCPTEFSKNTPLAGLHFLLDRGPFHDNLKQRDLAVIIRKFGGSLLTKVTSGLLFVTTAGEASATARMPARARKANMKILDSTVFRDLANAHSAAELENLIAKKLLTVSPTPDTPPSIAAKSEANPEQEMVKRRIKGGAVVDLDSGLEDRASVAKDREGRPLSAVLGLVDLDLGVNSYYRLQVLQADKNRQTHWVFRAWGRIGTNIGGTKLERYPYAKAALRQFRDLFLEKTGQDWDTPREAFEKLPFHFYPLDMDFGVGDSEVPKQIKHCESKLDSRLQALINFLFDVNSMNDVLLEFEIDVRKMPLGKISRQQIHEAYGILNALSDILEDCQKTCRPIEGSDRRQLIGHTNRFFTLIPHDFGMKSPPLLDNLDFIKSKSHMLEDLLELEIAYSLMKTGNHNINPLDEHYQKLRNKLTPLERDSEDFDRITSYLRLTHAATHASYSLEVVDVFMVERNGETERYQPFQSMDNRMMLWHGSRRTNWPGILAQGLRIAPPEAPVTGYMFGKGVYFADVSSKSANYCFASSSSTRGCLLLCEVALGRMQHCTSADATPLPVTCNSRKGVGSQVPNSETYYEDPTSGVVYPMGKLVDSSEGKSDLLYNEYVVYNTSQIQQRYLVWVDFKFNY